jgi:hypothetical protein
MAISQNLRSRVAYRYRDRTVSALRDHDVDLLLARVPETLVDEKDLNVGSRRCFVIQTMCDIGLTEIAIGTYEIFDLKHLQAGLIFAARTTLPIFGFGGDELPKSAGVLQAPCLPGRQYGISLGIGEALH